MSLSKDISRMRAAIMQKYGGVFRGDIDHEADAYRLLAKNIRKEAEEITGAGRAIASMTEGKGE